VKSVNRSTVHYIVKVLMKSWKSSARVEVRPAASVASTQLSWAVVDGVSENAAKALM